MKLVVDTKVLMSALIRNSISRRIIVESGWTFYYPSVSLKEIENHEELILEKSGMGNEEYQSILNVLFDYIRFISLEKFSGKMEEARQIIQHIDPDDVVFLALALSVKNDGIWTDDRHFQMQKEIKVYTTEQIVKDFDSED